MSTLLALLLAVPVLADEPVETAPAEDPAPTEEPLPVQEPAPALEPVAMVVTLSDGQTLAGRAARLPDGSVRLWLADGEELLLPAEAVARLRPAALQPGAEASRWGPDPNRSRYLYSPTAFPLGQGNGYVAQRALVLTTGAVGLLPFLDLELGLVLPALFTSTPIGTAGLKLAVPVSDKVHLGGGAQAVLVPVEGFQAIGFAFGNASYGTPDTHATLAGGAALDFGTGELGAAVATLGANHRLGPGTALITENWFVWFTQGDGPWGTPLFVVPSGGVRLFGPSFAVDLALVPVVTGEREVPVLPLPWVSFAWNWTLRKERG